MAVSNGSAQLHAIAAALKEVADGRVLRTELNRAIRTAAQPLVGAVKQSAEEKLPKAGGLNKQVAGQRVSVSVLTSLRTAGVRLRTTAPDTAMTDSGFVRHPTFGRRSKGDWKTQQIPRAVGWWTNTLRQKSPAVTPAILAVMERTAARIRAL